MRTRVRRTATRRRRAARPRTPTAPTTRTAERRSTATTGASAHAVPCAYATIWSSTFGVTGPNFERGHDAVGTDRVRLGLPAGAEVERRLRRPGRSATGQVDVVAPSRSRAPRRRLSSRTMPSIDDVGSARCCAVPAGQRVVLLPARDAPRVPEVHDHGLAGQARRDVIGRAVEVDHRERGRPLADQPARVLLRLRVAAHGHAPAPPRARRRRHRPRARPTGTGASHRPPLRPTGTRSSDRVGQRPIGAGAPERTASRRRTLGPRATIVPMRHQPAADPDPQRHRVHRDADRDPPALVRRRDEREVHVFDDPGAHRRRPDRRRCCSGTSRPRARRCRGCGRPCSSADRAET